MKFLKFPSLLPAAALTASGVAALMFTGCGPSQPPPAPPAAEIRGEAINSPVVETAKAEPAAPAPTAPTNTAPGVLLPSGVTVAAPTEAAPAATNDSKPAPEKTAPKSEDGFLQVGFDRLAAFNYEVPDGPVEAKEGEKTETTPLKQDQIPKEVKSLDRQRVALQGFMLPLKVENGLITELLIMRDQSMCCYGTVPKINEWVSVKMTSKGVKPIMDQAVTIYGKLKVGEIMENGYLVGIYEMDGERMAGPLEL